MYQINLSIGEQYFLAEDDIKCPITRARLLEGPIFLYRENGEIRMDNRSWNIHLLPITAQKFLDKYPKAESFKISIRRLNEAIY